MQRAFLWVFGILLMAGTSGTVSAQISRNYKRTALCEVASRSVRAGAKLVSIDAEIVNAMPHGLFLIDERCPRISLQIDFARTGIDPSLKALEENMFCFHRATGTFRGRIKFDSETRRRYLWLESLINFNCEECSEPFEDKPINLPDPPLPTLPFNR